MANYQVGDKVRVMQVPPYLYTNNPANTETAEFFERCLGKVFPVEGFDEYGQLELWATDKGNSRPGRNSHVVWIEPEYVEPFPKPASLRAPTKRKQRSIGRRPR